MGVFDGKVAMVSGSGRGIGRALAEKFAREGARLVINDLDEAPAAEAVAAMQALGAEAVACVGSVTDDDFPDRFVAAAVENFGVPDIIVNNAGYTWDNVIQKMDDKQFRDIIDVHLVAPFRILRAAGDVIREAAKVEIGSGNPVHRKVVNISSVSGVYGNAGQANYSSAKAGIVGLTKALAKEWGRYNVNVNAVAFGLINTRLTQALDDEGASINIEGREIAVGIQRKRLQAADMMIPLGHAGSVEEAAGAVYILCLPEANYVSGQLLICDGGGR